MNDAQIKECSIKLNEILRHLNVQAEELQAIMDKAETFADTSERYTDQGGCEHYLPTEWK